MNILYLCADRGIPIRGHKGAAVHVRAIANAFGQAGHRVTILSPRLGPQDGPQPAGRLVEIGLPERDHFPTESEQLLAYGDQLLAAAIAHHHANPFDMIYERYSLWSDVGARLSAAIDRPLVLEVNAPLVEEAARYRDLPPAAQAAAAEIEARQFAGAAHVAVVSEPLAAYVAARGASPERVHVLPNGIDPQSFHPGVRGGKIRGRYGLEGRLVVGFVGRPRPWHDLETLLQAFARLAPGNERFHLLLVGQMPDDLDSRLRELQIENRVTATGAVPHEEVPPHIAAMDVAVSPHPDLPDFYFSPLKLTEYMACAVPAVATDIGQPARLIRHGENGLLYPAGDDEKLAAAIRNLVDNPSWARRLAWRAAEEVLESRTWERNAAAVLDWIRPAAPMISETAGDPPPISLPILDGKLRHRLYQATRPDLAAPLLARHIPLFGRDGSQKLKRVEAIEVLKYKPNRRCVLGYELTGRRRGSRAKTTLRVIGKVFKDDRGLRLHKIHDFLRRNGFGEDNPHGIAIPASLAYVPELRMQVQAYAPGLTLNELVEREPLAPYIPLAARGLAALHRLPTGDLLPENWGGRLGFDVAHYLLGDELEHLERFTAGLLAMRPQNADLIRRLAADLGSWAERLPALPAPVPLHRDFYYSQLLLEPGSERLTLIDFDLFALGDPAVDVANFTAHLHFMGLDLLGDFDALSEEAQLFLAHYGRHVPLDDSFHERLAFYQAATFFRLLHVISPRPGLVHLFDELAARTTRSLEVARS